MPTHIGVDLGGTNVRAGRVKNGKIAALDSRVVRKHESRDEVLADLYASIDAVIDRNVRSIGLGAPSLVNQRTGAILDTTNIASFRAVPLKRLLEKRYKIPVNVDNDANCFALGERLFGAGKGCANFVGLVLGTGLGAGVVANGRLVSGTDGGAGEFGLVPYRDGIVENFASGQFFRRFGREGSELGAAAARGDADAARLFGEFGVHLAFAVKTILYALAPSRIVLGGSVSRDFSLFRASLEQSLRDFAYPSLLEQLEFRVSRTPYSAILGAASLLENIK